MNRVLRSAALSLSFTLAVAFAAGCAPQIAEGAGIGYPAPGAPAVAFMPAPIAMPVPVQRAEKSDRFVQARAERQAERAFAKRPRSTCPGCD